MSTPTPRPPGDDRPDAETGPAAPPTTATPAATDTTPEPEVGDRWGTLPPPERRAELDARLATWAAMPDHGKLLGPFDTDGWDGWNDQLTGADVYYLAARSLVGPDGDIASGLAHFRKEVVSLPDLHLEHANLAWAHLEHAHLVYAHLEHAALVYAHLEHAKLGDTHLEHANLWGAHLANADLAFAHLERADFLVAILAGADLRSAFLDAGTNLTDATVTDAEHGSARLADVRWQGVNLAVVKEWPADMVLGDEEEAWKLARKPLPPTKTREERRDALEERRDEVREAFRAAARANRQLAAAMRDQGMNDEADHFAYRAQVMQRELYRRQGRTFRAGFSRFLDLIAGYGYKPERSVAAYVLVILTFAAAYFTLGHIVGPVLSPYGAAVFSMTSFHGRGFFPGGISIEDPITGLSALEALCGLIIEVSLIATFTQRFFGK